MVVVVVVDKALLRRASGTNDTPRLRIEPFAQGGEPGNWTVRWQVRNEGTRRLRLIAAVQPHAQFRTPDTAIEREVASGAQTEIVLPVRFTATPGTLVENPFLILRLADGDQEWRVLARVSVTAGPRGEPIAGNTVSTTTHRVGAI
jgi:hypothetical protein